MGLVHGLAFAVSRAQVKTAVGSAWVNEKVASVVLTKAAGFAVIDGAGVGGAAMAIPAPRIESPTTKSSVVVAARPRRAKCFIERPVSLNPRAATAAYPFRGISTAPVRGQITQ